ncbi:MAG: serine hydrolase [Alphaproteobacteria bacterium]|nr:serine hydrolase [Alphaproteobacteria bacterium]
MTTKLNRKHFLAVALISGFAGFSAAFSGDASPVPEATETEAAGTFRDIPSLEKAFIDTAPTVRDDAFPVGELDVGPTDKANIVKLAQEIGEGKYGRYDSLLIAHKDRLVFESYFRRGRINLAHPQASATKGHTSLILGRAMQLGYLTMADLDRPLIDFLGDLDRSKLVDGAEKITLHKALTMHGGLSISDEQREELEREPDQITAQLADQVRGQGLVQTLLESSGPITDETQVYKYGNFNPMLVMTVVDAVVPGGAKKFIETEFLGKLGITNYSWGTHASGLPQAGWMISITSRDMLKFGSIVLNEGKWSGEQFIPEDYLDKATSGLVKPTEEWMPEPYRYGYFFYQTLVEIGGKSYDVSFAWGGGDQRIIVVDDLDLVVVFTGHDNEGTLMDQVLQKVLPAFAE